MGATQPEDAYRRSGDVLLVNLLEEMRYLRKRLDELVDGMATKADLNNLSTRLDGEVRNFETKVEKTELAIRGDFTKTIDEVKKMIPPPAPNTGFVVGATATITTIVVSLIGYIVFLQIALHGRA